MAGKRSSNRRPGGGHQLDPETVDRLIDAVQKGGSDRARYLAKRAGSEAEAEVVCLVAAIREIGTARVPVSESRVDAITAALQEESSTKSWLLRWHHEIEVLLTGVGSGATLWYGLTQLDQIVMAEPANPGATLLVAVCGALVCLLLYGRVIARERLKSE